ncbi:hypothetical protein FB451DRAFT_1200915 [Mycena latifolia]|nr:hypothetical protein FB451DRAFT_1200915 [Mycena latifolia]
MYRIVPFADATNIVLPSRTNKAVDSYPVLATLVDVRRLCGGGLSLFCCLVMAATEANSRNRQRFQRTEDWPHHIAICASQSQLGEREKLASSGKARYTDQIIPIVNKLRRVAAEEGRPKRLREEDRQERSRTRRTGPQIKHDKWTSQDITKNEFPTRSLAFSMFKLTVRPPRTQRRTKPGTAMEFERKESSEGPACAPVLHDLPGSPLPASVIRS